MDGVHGGAAGLIVRHDDTFECVDFATCGPVWNMKSEGGPDGALDMRREG